jgi:hypothetical protein
LYKKCFKMMILNKNPLILSIILLRTAIMLSANGN